MYIIFDLVIIENIRFHVPTLFTVKLPLRNLLLVKNNYEIAEQNAKLQISFHGNFF